MICKSEAWRPPKFQGKRSWSEKAILGALGEFQDILGTALRVQKSGRLIFIHLRCWEVLPLLTIQSQRSIRYRVLGSHHFYTPLPLNCQKGQHFPALVVYKNPSPKNNFLGMKSPILGMASQNLSNAKSSKTTLLGAILGAIPGIDGNPHESFSFALAFSERSQSALLKNWCGPRAPELEASTASTFCDLWGRLCMEGL